MTVYTDWFPSRFASACVRHGGRPDDRHLTFDPEFVESERGVVLSERRLRVDNDNVGALSEQVDATAIMAHPYHWPVSGWSSDTEAWTTQDLETYYRQGYAPNNCTMVVVGDVAAVGRGESFELSISSRFHLTQPFRAAYERARTSRVRDSFASEKEAELPLLIYAFHLPESRNEKYPAIVQVLESIMATGDSSRLSLAAGRPRAGGTERADGRRAIARSVPDNSARQLDGPACLIERGPTTTRRRNDARVEETQADRIRASQGEEPVAGRPLS